MKIQCGCGTKIAFDITPDMAVNPVQFICPNCGLDSSPMVNQIIRQELGVSNAPPAPPPPAVKPAVRVAIQKPAPAPAPAPGDGESAASPGREFCLKHPGQEMAHKCVVCGKPMCPECMSLFGYVCSPLCKNKAERGGQKIPVYAHQKSVVESRRWRKIGLVAGGIAGLLVLLAGAWFWYAWFGSVPGVSYSLKFADRVKSGSVHRVDANSLVYLHGGELGRIDLKQSQPVWTAQLVDRQKFGPQADATIAELLKARDRHYDTEGGDPRDFKIPARDELIEDMTESAMRGLELHVAGQNIWIASRGSLTRHDWQTGKAGQTLRLEGSSFGAKRVGNELILRGYGDSMDAEIVQHIDLVTGEARKESIEKPVPTRLVALLTAAATNKTATAPGAKPAAVSAAAAKVIAANQARRPGAPLDPQKLAEEAGGLSAPGKLALPALIANARNQQRIAEALAETSDAPPRAPTEIEKALEEWDSTRTHAAADGPVQFSSVLIERKLVKREAMKAPPKNPALNESVSAGNSLAVASEMLNEMQRERGSTVTEDHSRYQVTVKRARSSVPDWSGEVTGPPAFHALKTVDLITAGTTVIALDHDNKKMWQAVLNFPVRGGMDVYGDEMGLDSQAAGLGPCVERGDKVYIFDQGSLAAFDRATGNARWRLPSAGIAGLWFDDRGMIYVNTTTAGPESIRYSKQINLADQTLSQILKVDPKTGKTLWSREGAKHICYMWKQYIFTADTFQGDDPDGEGLMIQTGIERAPFLRIRRIDAGSGRILWEHVQKRCPLDMSFHQNTIQLMFRKELQQLTFLAL